MKKSVKIVLIVLVILIVIGQIKNVLIKFAVQGGVRAVTGLPMTIGKFDLGIITTKVDIRDLKIHNTKEFLPEKIMLDMPTIYVDYNLTSFFKGKVHINDIKINMKEFVVVRNKDGKLNLDALKRTSKPSDSKEATKEKPKAKKPTKMPEIQIDNLELKIGKVIYKDYSKGDEPVVREFNVNIDEKHENITNPQALMGLIVFKALAKTSLGALVDLDTYKDLASGAADTAKKAAKITSDAAKKVVEKTGEALKKTSESLRGLLPFGGEEK